MNSATKVGEIFTAAGQAFTRLGDLTMQLHCNNAESASGKWTDEEIDMLHTSIMRFSDDLSKISLSIKNRTVSQIRQALKKKAFEDAGIPAKQVPVQQVQHVIQTVQQLPIVQQQTAPLVQQQQVFKSHIIQSQQQQQQQQHHHHQNSSISTSTLPVVQQQQPQAVHIQHVQHIMPVAPVTSTQQTLLQTQPKQIILQPQTTTVTIKQFQQMQQQKAAALAAAQAAAAAAAANAPTITENIIIQQPTTTTTAHAVAAATSATAATTTSAGTVVVNDGAVVSATTTTAAPTNTSTGLKCGPDVSMTLNRINVQENEVDVEECLPAEVVKLDFASEEVAG